MKKYRDHYFKKAKEEQYPARSVYKLKEMDKRFNLFSSGQKILDLGAAPGSWALYVSKRVGNSGKVIAVDLQRLEISLPNQVQFLQSDILSPSEDFKSDMEQNCPVDVILSDMAPQTTGIKIRDQAQSLELAEQALELCKLYLRQGGSFVVKVFEGPDVPDFTSQVKSLFKKVKNFKPKSSRAESKEIYLLGFGLK